MALGVNSAVLVFLEEFRPVFDKVTDKVKRREIPMRRLLQCISMLLMGRLL